MLMKSVKQLSSNQYERVFILSNIFGKQKQGNTWLLKRSANNNVGQLSSYHHRANNYHHHHVNNNIKSRLIEFGKVQRMLYSTKVKTIKINENEEITTSQLLEYLSGNVIQFAKSSEYSQSFNKLLRHATPEEFERVFLEIQPNIYELCTDSNGSIVMERVILRSLPHQLDIIFNSLFSEDRKSESIKLFTEESASRVISKLIPKLTSSQIERLLGLLNFNSLSVSTLLENENSTNLLTQMIDIHLNSIEVFLKQPMIELLLNLDDEQINEYRLRQPLAKCIEKSSTSLKLELIKSLTDDDITQLDDRHSYALSRVYTRLPSDSKEFENTSALILKNFFDLSMKRDHKDVINAFIGYSEKKTLDALINSISTNQVEELLKDKNGLVAFSYLFSRVSCKIDILNKLSEKIVNLSKDYTSSFFFSSLVAENKECALAIIQMVKPHLLDISTHNNSKFLSIKIAEYPEGRKALLKSFKYNIVDHYITSQQVISHLINKCTSQERGEILNYCILPQFNDLNGDISEPLFKIVLLLIKKGTLNDHTTLVKSFEGRLVQMSTERNTSIILQELYQVSPQVIRDIINYELLGNIQNVEELNITSLQALTTNKHAKHLLITMLRHDPTLKTSLSSIQNPSLNKTLSTLLNHSNGTVHKNNK